jgi:DNA-binding MarR family transcriptional regulator
MLLQLREYIRREHFVSIQQLSRAFHIDESALRPMLDRFVEKGFIRALQRDNACQSTCSGCHTSAVVFYESQN